MNYSENNNKINISAFKSDHRRVCSTHSSAQNINNTNNTIVHAQTELDSHADSIVAGSNCCVMHYTNRKCDVSPYRYDYAPITNIPIVQAATAYQSEYTGLIYIPIFNEA